MIFLWFWSLSVFLIWFWYDFLMVLESLRFLDMIFLWFWSLSVFLIWFWYDFLMVLESLRFLDMIFLWFWSLSVFLIWFSYGFGVPPSFWCDFVIVFVRPHLPPRSPDPGHTSHPPLVGPQPHLPPLSPDSSHTFHPRRRTPATPPTPVAGPTSHPLARQWNHWGTLWFQTLVSFWFFWISRHVAACYRPTEFSLNISFTILSVRLATRTGFQCCCKLSLGFSHSFHIPLTNRRVVALLQTSSHRYSSAQAIPTYRQSFPYSYYSVASLFQNFCPGVCVPCAHYYNCYYYRWWLDFIRTVLMMSWTAEAMTAMTD